MESANLTKLYRKIIGLNWSLNSELGAYRVEQDVGGLKITVDHRRVGAVEEGEALGRTDCNLHPCHPWEGAIDTCRRLGCFRLVSSSTLINKHE
jgi:hypothetical protein